jgi:DNA-binding winged helix-turn-helix (wHTH) protein
MKHDGVRHFGRPRSVRIGTCEVQFLLQQVRNEGKVVRLAPKVLAVLEKLIENLGDPVSKNALLDHVWPEEDVTEDVVTNAIVQLRKAFGDSSRLPTYIQTVSRAGYALIARVDRGEACGHGVDGLHAGAPAC